MFCFYYFILCLCDYGTFAWLCFRDCVCIIVCIVRVASDDMCLWVKATKWENDSPFPSPSHRSYPGLVVPAFALQSNLFYDDLPPTEEAQDIPTTLWVLRHTLRFKKDEPQDTRNTKPIFDMDVTRGAFSHAQVTCVDVIGKDDFFSLLSLQYSGSAYKSLLFWC